MKPNLTIKPTLPLGFKANGLACGIKKRGRCDLGLIFSEKPSVACGLFTANKITSGSIKFSQANLNKARKFRAIIVNSGNANCFTNEDSFDKADEIADELARILKIKTQEVLLASTGIIARPFPVQRIKKAIPALVEGLSGSGLTRIARAIITTDTFIKLSSVRLNIGKRIITICGLAKGAGMIAPNLISPCATMLCFILSDANITQKALRVALQNAVDNSFNCITIDGCMSTNDTLLMLSNSAAFNPKIKEGTPEFNEFCSGLSRVCLSLAKMIVRDAEGATKFIQIKVTQARSYKEAKQVALSIANSNLFKAAMFGRSANFGRIIAAVGASGVDVVEKDLKVKVSSLKKKDIYVIIGLNRGNCAAVVYTSDLTPEYVKINASYS